MFRGQDAWRRHPLLSGNWKTPFPGLGTAIVIYTGYLAFEYAFTYVTATPKSPPKQTMIYTTTGDRGDMMPEGVPKKKAGDHH
mmetsp:Transcript_16655/g.16018  ORF Transcript_16655/g.16018 Transcript_16655/m.16018 type:complete len:83 (-) Transcript_16655:144-392(-)